MYKGNIASFTAKEVEKMKAKGVASFYNRKTKKWHCPHLSVFWERGSPDLPACGPRRGSASVPVRPIFTNKHSRPSRGVKPREADDARYAQERPHQVGSRGAKRSRQGKPCEVLVT